MNINWNPIVLPEKHYFVSNLNLRSQKLFYKEGENTKIQAVKLEHCVTGLSINTIFYPLFALTGLICAIPNSIKCAAAFYKKYQVQLLLDKVNSVSSDLNHASKKDLDAIQSYATKRTVFCHNELKIANSNRESLIARLHKKSPELKEQLEKPNFFNTDALLDLKSQKNREIKQLKTKLDGLLNANSIEIAKEYQREQPNDLDKQCALLDLSAKNSEFKETNEKKILLQDEKDILTLLIICEISIKAYSKQLELFEKFDIKPEKLDDLKNVLELSLVKRSLTFLEYRWKVTNFAKLMVPSLGLIWAGREFPDRSATQAGEPQDSWGQPASFAAAHNRIMEEDKQKGILMPYVPFIRRKITSA